MSKKIIFTVLFLLALSFNFANNNQTAMHLNEELIFTYEKEATSAECTLSVVREVPVCDGMDVYLFEYFWHGPCEDEGWANRSAMWLMELVTDFANEPC